MSLKNHHISREVVTLKTLTIVDPADSEFQKPYKAHREKQSMEMLKTLNWKRMKLILKLRVMADFSKVLYIAKDPTNYESQGIETM
jgi:uncharacterized membrane protein (DUF106 family)